MLNQEALTKAITAIQSELGNLDDLPRELANTVCNVYYNYYSRKIKIKKPGAILSEVPKTGDLCAIETEIQNVVYEQYLYEWVPDAIIQLKNIDPTCQPNMYVFLKNLILDFAKYHIPRTFNKPEIIRKILRLYYSKKVNEIPDLINKMGIL